MWQRIANDQDIRKFHLEDLRLGHTAVLETLHDIEDGRGSGENSGPPEVYETKYGDWQVSDGHHRIVEALLKGNKTHIKARIIHRGSEWYRTMTPEEAFKPKLDEPYGGLHRVMDEELLHPIANNPQQWKRAISSIECQKDEQGFHIDENGRRIMERDGRDAYARRCTKCGTIGYPSRDWSRFIEGEDGWKYR